MHEGWHVLMTSIVAGLTCHVVLSGWGPAAIAFFVAVLVNSSLTTLSKIIRPIAKE